MKATLIVKNFGPIEHAELDLRNVNVFIGPQASGKSTLAKLYTICKSPLSFLDDSDILTLNKINNSGNKSFEALKFESALEDLNILNFLNKTSVVEFESELHYFKYSRGKIGFERKLEAIIRELDRQIVIGDLVGAKEVIVLFSENILSFNIDAMMSIFKIRKKRPPKTYDEFFKFTKQFNFKSETFSVIELERLSEDLERCEQNMLSQTANYIPAERVLIPILKGATFGLMQHNVAIPKHILNFAATYERATSKVKELDLSFIKNGLSYRQVNGVDHIFFSPKRSVTLAESATGLQSLIPLLLPIKFDSEARSRSYVIEEPEINLFPKAQYNLMKYLEEERRDGTLDSTFSHTYTTHSPYILSAFNNMLYAFKKWNDSDKSVAMKEELGMVLPKANWLNPENFNAYSIQDGTAIQILDRELGLIGENVIDEISDEMSDDFDRLMDI